MTEKKVKIYIQPDPEKPCFADIKAGQFFVYEESLYLKIQGIDADFQVNAIGLEYGTIWNFADHETVEPARVDISAWVRR